MTQPPSKRLVTEAALESDVAAKLGTGGALDVALAARVDSGQELAYSSNETATQTAVAVTTAAFAPGVMIEVPATTGPVELRYGAAFNIVTPGAGLVGLQVFDVTASGAGTKVAESYFGVSGALQTLYSGFENKRDFSHRLPPSSTAKVYTLMHVLFRDTSSGLTASLDNSANGINPTYLAAVAR